MIQLISPGISQASLFPNLEIPGRDWVNLTATGTLFQK